MNHTQIWLKCHWNSNITPTWSQFRHVCPCLHGSCTQTCMFKCTAPQSVHLHVREFIWVPTVERQSLQWDHSTDGQMIHSLQTGLFIMFLRVQKYPPWEREEIWCEEAKKIIKSCTLAKMSHSTWEASFLMQREETQVGAPKINRARKKKKKAAFTWPLREPSRFAAICL